MSETGPLLEWVRKHDKQNTFAATVEFDAAIFFPFVHEQDAQRAALERAVRHAAYRSYELSDGCDGCIEVRAVIAAARNAGEA